MEIPALRCKKREQNSLGIRSRQPLLRGTKLCRLCSPGLENAFKVEARAGGGSPRGELWVKDKGRGRGD